MQVNGNDFNTKIIGSGAPFIWSHGLFFSMEAEDEARLFDWHSVADVATLLRYDALGHGKSEVRKE